MKKILIMICLSIFSVFIFGAGNLQSALQTEDSIEADMLKGESKKLDAYVTEYKAKVFIKYNDKNTWNQIVNGVEVKEKSTIITMEGSAVNITLKTGTQINIGEKSKAVFETLKEYPKKENLTETALKLAWGTVYSNVKKLGTGSKYEVKTGSATCGVRGTMFYVTSESGETRLVVLEGTVNIASLAVQHSIDVTAKQKVNVDTNGEFGKIQSHNDSPPPPIGSGGGTGDGNGETDPNIGHNTSNGDAGGSSNGGDGAFGNNGGGDNINTEPPKSVDLIVNIQ